MPVVELDVGGQTHRVEVDPGFTPDDLDEIAAHIQSQQQTASPSPAPTTTPTSTPAPGILQAMGNAAMERVVKPVAQSAYNLSPLPVVSDIYRTFTGTPEERKQLILEKTQSPTKRLFGKGLDIATVAGPYLGPLSTAAGVITQGGLEAAGVDKGSANVLGTAAELAGPIGSMLRSGTEKAMERFATKEIGQLTAGTADETGAVIKQVAPKRLAKAKDVVGGMFDRLRADASRTGTMLMPGTPEYIAAGQALDDTRALLGPNLAGRNAKILDEFSAAIAQGQPLSYQQVDDAARFLGQNVGGGNRAVTKFLRGAQEDLRDAQAAMVKGTPLEPRLALARARWANEVAPYDKMVAKVADRETTNMAAFQRTAGSTTDAGRVKKLLRLVGENTPEAEQIRGGFFSQLAQQAQGDAGAFTRAWNATAPEVKAVMAGKNAATVDRLMTRLDKVAKAQSVGKGLGGVAGKVVTGLSLPGGAGAAALQFYNGERDPVKLAIPLAVAAGSSAGRRLLTLAVKGASTPAGTEAGARLMTLIAAEAHRLGMDQ